jgi:hypothetical protein
MLTYYYSYRQVEGGWDKQPQYFTKLNSWTEFVELCYTLSFHLKKEIRGCESKGYNNQGHYFMAGLTDDSHIRVND